MMGERSLHPHAFTLMEVLVAMAVASILLLAISSSVMLASQAIPDGSSRAAHLIETGKAVEQFSTDLQHALRVTEREANAITFTVADRDGDGSPQAIRYQWVAGEDGRGPVTRQIDNDAAETLLDDVAAFELRYDVAYTDEQYAGPAVENTGEIFSKFSDLGYFTTRHVGVDPSNWIGQRVQPTFAGNVLKWAVVGVVLNAKQQTASDTDTHVQFVLPAATGEPDETPSRSMTISRSAFDSSYAWQWASAGDAMDLLPGQAMNLIVRTPGTSGTSAQLRHDIDASGGGLLLTGNAGATWTRSTSRSLLHYVFGTIFTEGPAQTFRRTRLASVGLKIQPDGAEQAMPTEVTLLNRPLLATNHWQLDFQQDPTSVDVDADGSADWLVEGGGNFDASDLNEGIWDAAQTLRTQPACDFTLPTILRARFRAAAVSSTAGIQIYADRSGDIAGPIIAQLTKLDDSNQTLSILAADSGGTIVPVATIAGLPSSMIDLRLLIDPVTDNFHVQVNGIDKGSYRYYRTSSAGSVAGIVIESASGSDSEFDYFSAEVLEP